MWPPLASGETSLAQYDNQADPDPWILRRPPATAELPVMMHASSSARNSDLRDTKLITRKKSRKYQFRRCATHRCTSRNNQGRETPAPNRAVFCKARATA